MSPVFVQYSCFDGDIAGVRQGIIVLQKTILEGSGGVGLAATSSQKGNYMRALLCKLPG